MRTLNHPSIIKLLDFIETTDVRQTHTRSSIDQQANLFNYVALLFDIGIM